MTNYFIALHEKNLFSETSGCFVKQPQLQGRMTGTLNQTRKMKDLNDSRHCRVFYLINMSDSFSLLSAELSYFNQNDSTQKNLLSLLTVEWHHLFLK